MTFQPGSEAGWKQVEETHRQVMKVNVDEAMLPC